MPAGSAGLRARRFRERARRPGGRGGEPLEAGDGARWEGRSYVRLGPAVQQYSRKRPSATFRGAKTHNPGGRAHASFARARATRMLAIDG